MDASHVLALKAREVVVDRDDVHALARERIQVGGHGARERLAFARLHLCDAPLMEHDAAEHLHAELTLARHAVGRLADDRERLGQDVVDRRALLQAILEFLRFFAELIVRQFFMCFLKGIDLVDDFAQTLELRAIPVAKYFL